MFSETKAEKDRGIWLIGSALVGRLRYSTNLSIWSEERCANPESGFDLFAILEIVLRVETSIPSPKGFPGSCKEISPADRHS